MPVNLFACCFFVLHLSFFFTSGVHGISGTTNIAATALKKKAEKEAEKVQIAKEKAIKDKADKVLKNKKSAATRKRASLNVPKKVESSSSSSGSKRRRFSADAADEMEVRDSEMHLEASSVPDNYSSTSVSLEEDLGSESPYCDEQKVGDRSVQDDAGSDVSGGVPVTMIATDADSDGGMWGDSYHDSQ